MIDPVEQHLRSGRYVRDLTYLGFPITESVLVGTQQVAGGTGVVCLFMEALHRKRGIQMRVQKEVSDDMLLTDLGNLTFNDVAWPASSVELYFEDPTLPTVLVSKSDGYELQDLIGGGFEIQGGKEPRIMARLEQPNGTVLALNIKEPLWDRMFVTGESVHMNDSLPLDPMEEKAMSVMLKLAFKVFAYASLPRYTPGKVGTITRAMGGKPGFKHRPNRPAVRVVYLPTAHTAYDPNKPVSHSGTTKAPHDRRGFFRMYRDERYVNMRGKHQFIAPMRIHGGATASGGKVFVVRGTV